MLTSGWLTQVLTSSRAGPLGVLAASMVSPLALLLFAAAMR